jgi:uncharacterized protein (DUF433 family)
VAYEEGTIMNHEEGQIVSRNPEVVSGALVFTGTRVPAQTLVDYLKAGHTLDDFLDGFPGVSREQAVTYLEMAHESAEEHLGAGAAR